MHMISNFRKFPARIHGFSMVEMMVAMVITLILMAGVSQIFLGSKKSYNIQDTLGRMQENGRYAMEMVITDLRRAGYWGGNADINKIEDNTPAGVLNGNNIATEDGTCTSTNWARMLSRPVFGLDDNRTSYSCLQALATGISHIGDILVTRYAAPWVVGSITTPSFNLTNQNQFFIRSTLFSGKLFRGQDEPANPITVGAVNRTAELVSNGYYLHNSTNSDPNKCPGSATIPSLYRVGLVNGALQSEEIAYGVDQFQVQYGQDTNGDGSVDSYVDAPAATDTTGWGQVIAARVWLLMRAECPETGYANINTYTMGNVNYPPAPDSYRRQLFTSTVSLRN
jgi:type IV pilus assembly protein PilW